MNQSGGVFNEVSTRINFPENSTFRSDITVSAKESLRLNNDLTNLLLSRNFTVVASFVGGDTTAPKHRCLSVF